MFTALACDGVRDAAEAVKKILAELDVTKPVEFQVIHSLSETECTEDGGTWDKAAEVLLVQLRDLDGLHGYMQFDHGLGGFWDFVEWPAPKKQAAWNEHWVGAGEGLVVLHNPFALCEDEFPVVVVKASFWRDHQDEAVDMLKSADLGVDYTTKISPAVYVELFFSEAT